MTRLRTAGVVALAAFALSAMLASSASAVLFNYASGMYRTTFPIGLGMALAIATPSGTVECPNSVLNGTVLNNGAKTVKAVIESASFEGEGGGACSTSTGLGGAVVKANDLPWPETFKGTGEASFKGTKKVAFEVAFASGITCNFEGSKVAESFTLGSPGAPVPTVLSVAEQKFKVNKKTSSHGCPTEGHLSGSIELTGEGKTIETE